MSEPQDPNHEAHRPLSQQWSPPSDPPAYTLPPQYGPSQYGSPPQYGAQPHYGSSPGGWYGPDGQWVTQPPTPPSSSGRKTALIAAAVVVVLALAGIGAWLAVRKDSSGTPKKYGVPASFGGYSQLHGTTADRVDTAIRSLGNTAGGGAAKRIFDAATIGVYAHNSGDQPVLIALIVPTSVSGSAGGDGVARELLSGAVPDSTAFPSGSRGGSTRCGTATFGAARETMCGWSDSHASGLLVSVNESMTASGLAAITQTFRDASE